jgi:hypothetical protein
LSINALEGKLSSFGERSEPSKGALEEGGDLDGSSVSRSSRETLVAGLGRLAHLVLPGTAVP